MTTKNTTKMNIIEEIEICKKCMEILKPKLDNWNATNPNPKNFQDLPFLVQMYYQLDAYKHGTEQTFKNGEELNDI